MTWRPNPNSSASTAISSTTGSSVCPRPSSGSGLRALTDSDTLYLVGDITDGWRLKKRFFWPERHNAIVRRFMKKAKGKFSGMNFGGVEIRSAATRRFVSALVPLGEARRGRYGDELLRCAA